MTYHRSAKEARQAIIPDNKCPVCGSKQLGIDHSYPVMDVNPPIYTQGVKCVRCGFEKVYSWQASYTEDEE